MSRWFSEEHMEFDATQLMVAMFASLVGMALFVYGKRQRRAPHLIAGIVLVVYPYFVSNVYLLVAIFAALLGGLWVVVRLGA